MKNIKQQLVTVLCLAVGLTTFAQVGIGTIAPKAALDVVSTTQGFIMPRVADHTALTVSADQTGMQVYNTITKSVWLYDGTAWSQAASGSAAKFVDGTTAADAVFTGGNVGIGTTAPTNMLTIAGETDFDSNSILIDATRNNSSGGGIKIFKSRGTKAAKTTVLDGDYLGATIWGAYDGSDFVETALIQAKVKGTVSTGDIGSELIFNTRDVGGVNTLQRMVITKDGKVGIGTAEPISKIEMYTGNANNANGLTLSNGSSNSGRLFFLEKDGGTANAIFRADGVLRFTSGATPNSSSGSTKMVLSDNGNLGIGSSTNVRAKLEVSGYVLLGSSDAIADAAPQNGMIRYNTSTNKFQGRANGAWVNLH